MTALAADRPTPYREEKRFSFPCAAAKTFFHGAIVFLDASGNAEPATAATGKKAAGRCNKYLVSTIAAAERIEVEAGCFRYANGSSITKANIGQLCYADDDQTVVLSPVGRSAVGKIVDVDTYGVWVEIAPAGAPDAGQSQALTVQVRDLVNAQRNGFVAPRAGYIKNVRSVLLGAALTTGNATLTAKIATVAVTGGVITITQAGSAIGDIDLATPSALNRFAAGDFVEVTTGGTNAATAAYAEVTFDVVFDQ